MKTKLLLVVVMLVLALTACNNGGDKNISEGDAATCIALRGSDVETWEFSPLERAANNVCWLYQQSTR